MERVKLNGTLSIQEIKNKKNELIKNEHIQKLITSLKINEDEIENHLELFIQYLKINQDCFSSHHCKDCHHSTKGYQFYIKRDGNGALTDSLVICPFYQQYYQKKQNILYTTFLEEQILSVNNKTFLKDNIRLFPVENLQKLITLLNKKPINGIYFHLQDSKTRKKLLIALCDELLKNFRCSIIRFSSFLSELKAQFNTYKKDDTLYENVMTSPILIIDDLGGESISNWSRDEILLPLLDYRIQNELPTILCSDYDLTQLRTIYQKNKNDDIKAEKIVDKIKELTA